MSQMTTCSHAAVVHDDAHDDTPSSARLKGCFVGRKQHSRRMARGLGDMRHGTGAGAATAAARRACTWCGAFGVVLRALGAGVLARWLACCARGGEAAPRACGNRGNRGKLTVPSLPPNVFGMYSCSAIEV